MKSCQQIKGPEGFLAKGDGLMATLGMPSKLKGSSELLIDSGFRGIPSLSRIGSRERKVAYDVLDIMDFGVNCRSGFASPVSANLVLRRNDAKDQRKRWNSEKIQSAGPKSSSDHLCEALAIHQPSVAAIVSRAQSSNIESADCASRRSKRKNNRQV